MALSKDGRWLYQYRTSDTRYQSVYYIATFDTERNAFLPERAVVPLCEAGDSIPLQEPLRVGLLCSRTQDIRLIEIAPNGSPRSEKRRRGFWSPMARSTEGIRASDPPAPTARASW